MYFNNATTDKKVFSIIYGKGDIEFVAPEKSRVDGFYMMKVKFDKCVVMYTEEGLPDWGTGDKVQTLFYLDDINLVEHQIDFQPELLSKKQIHKYMDKQVLEMRCPSGIWRNVLNCPSQIVNKGLKNLSLHLFRRAAKD